MVFRAYHIGTVYFLVLEVLLYGNLLVRKFPTFMKSVCLHKEPCSVLILQIMIVGNVCSLGVGAGKNFVLGMRFFHRNHS